MSQIPGINAPITSINAIAPLEVSFLNGALTLSINMMGGGGNAVHVFQVNTATATGRVDSRGFDVQWVYDVDQAISGDGSGYGIENDDGEVEDTWSVIDRSGSATFHGKGYCFTEYLNTGDGRQGNGVDHNGSDFAGTEMKMQPLIETHFYPGILRVNGDGRVEAWMWWHNVEDGSC